MDSPQRSNNNSYGFYLYFFDEIGGHTPLFAYSEDSTDDKNEEKILSIHPVWWHQEKFMKTEKFLALDLEIGGAVYSATLFFCQTKRRKKRSGMNSIKWRKERFVLIVRSPSSVSFIAQEILYEIKNRIQGNIGEKLCFLTEHHFSANESPEVREFLSKQVKTIELQLRAICQDLVPKTPLSKLDVYMDAEKSAPTVDPLQEQNLPKLKKKLRFSIPSSKKKDKTELDEKKILELKSKRIKIVQIKHLPENDSIQVNVLNIGSQTLNNVLLKIIQSEGFFKKDLFVKSIEKWKSEEELTIEFEPIEDPSTIYFLRIEDEHELIKIKRILG